MTKININEKLHLFSDFWSPKIVGELNDQLVKLAKLKGEFIWHKHLNEDELFYVLEGELKVEFRDRTEKLSAGEMIIIPRGVEHRPIAEHEVKVMLFEPKTTLNTGDKTADFTQEDLDWI
jgi:mannose-6-phosphate isomerase-like protein (cupin superfamily)